MIPKVIHYCWFGVTDLPEKDKKCIESWKKYCPDYEINRWDETNYDIKKNQYMREAYDAKKWGFVPDYARLDIIYSYGGIYLDTDVELTRNIDDLLVNKAYMGFEDGKLVNPGLGFGAEKGNEMIGTIMHTIYDDRHFLMENGDFNMTPSPLMNTEFLIKRGLKQNNTIQNINGLVVYPKEFFCPIDVLSGVMTKTKDLHSIHHFHASWVEPEVQIENRRTQVLRRRFGNKIGGKLGRILNLPLRVKMKLRQNGFWGTIRFTLNKIKRRYIIQYVELLWYAIFIKPRKDEQKEVVIFDTSINSDNLGDQIINDYCIKILNELEIQPLGKVPTHTFPISSEETLLKKNRVKIITGTNILTSELNLTGLWHRPSKYSMQSNLCLLGVGWNRYSNNCNQYSKLFYHTCLNSKMVHSVRDSYTEGKFHEIGIHNVVNTTCPTMWKLTPDFCKSIPIKKAQNVITTITDYDQDQDNDWLMLDILLKHYNKVYLWLQGKGDLEYIHHYPKFQELYCIDSTRKAFNDILLSDNIEYVGTRLHAGIHALNQHRRSIIIGIDNRAIEIAKDTNLPVIVRKNLQNELETKILSEYRTDIHIPIDKINQWKSNFRKGEKYES